MDKERLKSDAEAGIVAMERMLADGSHDDAVFVLGKVVSILGLVHVPDGLTDEATRLLDDAQEKIEAAYSLMGGAEE